MKTAEELVVDEGRLASTLPPVSSAPRRPDQWVPPRLLNVCTIALRQLRVPALDSVGVTSCLRGEGRTTIAMGLALARRYVFGHETILVEFDLETPALADRLGLSAAPGVAEILRDGATLDECVRHHESGLNVLVAGGTVDDAGALIANLRRTDLVTDLGLLGHCVVADLPPLSPVGHGTLIADLFSTVILVVRAGATPASQIRLAVDGLDRPPAVILNGIDSPLPQPLRAMFGGSG